MSNLMKEAYERRRALEEDDAPAPRRPGPIAGPTRAPAWIVPGLVLGTAAALYLLFSSLGPPAAVPAPAETWPTPLPGASVPTAPWFAPGAEPAPTAAPAHAEEGIGTGEGFIEPVPQAAPAGVGGQAPQFVNPEPVVSDLVPLEEAPGWHPPLAPGQPAPTPNNFVMRRP